MPPSVVKTVPQAGDTAVDPATKETGYRNSMLAFFSLGPLELLILLAILGVLVSVPVIAAVVTVAATKKKGGPANPNLFPCPDCGRHVSRLAKSCPNCGRPFSSEGQN